MSNTADSVASIASSGGTETENMVTELTEEESQASEPEEVRKTGKREKGKPVHQIWSDAFDEPAVHRIQSPNNAICKHCKELVHHHHKTLSVATHLLKLVHDGQEKM